MARAGCAVERRDVPSEPIERSVVKDRGKRPVKSDRSDLQVFMEGLRQSARGPDHPCTVRQAPAGQQASPSFGPREFLGLYAPDRGEISTDRHAVGFRHYFFGFSTYFVASCVDLVFPLTSKSTPYRNDSPLGLTW